VEAESTGGGGNEKSSGGYDSILAS